MTQQTLDLLDRLIAFDTVSAKSNLALIAFVESYLSDRGFVLTRLPDATGQKAGLLARIGPGDGGVLLSAHSDVVPVAGQEWTTDPFSMQVTDGRAYGRGATDMKGFLAAMLRVADQAAQGSLSAPLALSISYDEEIGCVGIAQMIDHVIPSLGRPRVCIVGEPTEMQIATGHKGKIAMRATCNGDAGHSALSPNFVNAVHLATDFVAGLRTWQTQLSETGAQDDAYDVPYTTVHVGTLQGGQVLNMVPEHAELMFEVRHLGGSAEAIFAQAQALAAEVAAGYPPHAQGPRIDVQMVTSYPGLSTAKNAAVVRDAQAWGGGALTKVAFGTEAGFFDQIGIPTIVCGPGSMARQGHKADEYVSLAQLAACDQMLDRVLASLR